MYQIDYVNGVKLIYFKTNRLTNIFGLFTINGAFYETEKTSGLSHFCEHMFFNGTKDRTASDISRDIAIFGGDQNAHTSKQEVFCHISSSSEYYKNIIYNIMDMFFNSTFPEKYVEKERDIIIEEKKSSIDDPWTYLFESISQKFCDFNRGHPVLGEFETISSFKRDDIINYLIDTISLNQMAFVYVGPHSIDDIKLEMAKHIPSEHPYLNEKEFKKVEVSSFCVDAVPLENTEDNCTIELCKKDCSQKYVARLRQAVDFDSKDVIPTSVFSNALGSGFFSRMFLEIRQEMGLAYNCGSFFEKSYSKNGSSLCEYSIISTENLNKYLDALNSIENDVIKNGISEELMQSGKASLLYSVARFLNSDYSIAFNALTHFYGQLKSPDEMVEKIKSINFEDVNRAGKELLEKQFVMGILSPQEEEIVAK